MPRNHQAEKQQRRGWAGPHTGELASRLCWLGSPGGDAAIGIQALESELKNGIEVGNWFGRMKSHFKIKTQAKLATYTSTLFFCSCFSLSTTPHLLLQPDSLPLHPSLPFYFQASPFFITKVFLVSNLSEARVLFSKMAMNSCDKLSPPHVKMNSHMIVPREDVYISRDNGWTTNWIMLEILISQNKIFLLWSRQDSIPGSVQGCRMNVAHLPGTSACFTQRFKGRWPF